MKKRLFAALTIVLLLLLPVITLAAEKIVFSTSEWEPYVIMENGKVTGFNAETIMELCKRLGFEAEIKVFPFKRALMSVKQGESDAIFSVRQNKERAEYLYYPSEAINIERTVIIAKKGSNIKINALDNLKGKEVGVVGGYAYDAKFDNYQGMKKIEYYDDKQLVTMLTLRINLAAGADEGSIKHLCKLVGLEIEVVYVLNEEPSYIAFSKAIGEKGKRLSDKFSDALRN